MKLPKSLNIPVTRAQIDRPVMAAKAIRKLTSSSGKSKSSEGAGAGTGNGGTAADAADAASAGAAASDTAPQAAPTRETLTRTNGIDAAKVAAGVPTDH